MKQNMDQPSCKWNLLRLFTLICTTLVSTLSFGQAGNAPMQALPNFPGPMAIDGFVQRQGAAGDWLPGPGGATNTVFTNTCVALVPLAYRLIDPYNDQTNDQIFDGGNKLNDNPNDWGWRTGKPPAKDDINTAMVFIALNPVDNHIWLAISGDRFSTNGTSYIDFEFYQNSITKTTDPGGETGGFISTGPHNGRTVGDISITLEFTGGGSFATVKYQQWQPGSEAGSYDYFSITPAPGTAFAAANAGEINVPCGAFGETTYQPLQFVEGAIDLTALIGGTGLPGECGSLPFQTLFIKTKSSASNTADLKDFINPFDIDICFDVTAPVIACPNTLNLGCNPTIPPPSGATASDNCSGVVIPVSSDGPVQSTGCNRTMNRTWIATDACNNMSSCTQVINWTADNTAPSLTTGGTTTTLGCNPSAGDINGALGTASASDNCSTPTITVSDGSVSSNGCGRSQTRTWTARDACSGVTASAARTVTWTADVSSPVITTGGTTTTLGCNPSAGDINGALGTATATDACGVPTVSSSDGSVGSNGCGRSQTRTWTARDACGNSATASRTVTWTADVTAPVITTGGTGTTLGCNPSAGDINGALGTATATDACGVPTVSAPSDGTVSSNGCGRSQTRTWTATDACGNTATASRTVTWTADLTAPVITTGGTGTTLGCNPSAGDINGALGTATATDACGVPTVSSSDGSVSSNGCGRSQTRTWTARDACGNTSTAARTVTWTADVTPPVITTGGTTLTLGCNPSAGAIDAALGTATATDACGVPTLSSSDGTVVTTSCGRNQTRTWTARDACGNTATASRTVSWSLDPNPPGIVAGGTTTTLGCNPSAGDINGALGTATATDACSTPSISSSDGPVGSNGCGRSQTRTWVAIDGCSGLTATASRTVTWTADVTPPVITTGGTGTSLGCNPSAGDINGALGTATATDACGVPTVSAPSDGTVTSDGCSRSQTRTWTARDACGNTSTASRTVTWTADVTGPVITTGGTTTTLGCNPSAGDINGALGTATATDACGVPTVSSSDGSVSSNGCGRSQTRTWTARDACGNTSTASRTVTWTADVTGPVITTGGTTTTLGCNPSAGDINGALGTATATDACGVPTVSSSDGSVSSNGCSRSQTRSWTARDACGNTSTASRTVTWTADVAAPVITTGGPSTSLGCNPSANDIGAALGTATATDACGVPTVSSSDGSVSSNGCGRSQTRTWTARDACGNTATASRTVTWTADVTRPVFVTTPASVDIACDAPIPTAALPTASDACSTPTVTQTGTTDNAADCGTGFGRVVTRTWTARDACGNTATYTQTVRVACCPKVFCTYTQGAYGTDGGKMCDGENGGFSTEEFINAILANWGGSFSVGKPGHSVIVNSAQCVLDKLPGGGPARELVAGDVNLCNFTPLQPNGGVRNILLAQTVTLGLNLGIENSLLGGFVLQAGELATADLVEGCGGETPEVRVCHYNVLAPYNLISVENEYTYRTFTQEVIDAIPGANTVANLFELANRALADVDGVDGSEGGASLDAINQAVSSVNEVFDGCRAFIGWNVSRCPAIDPTPGDGRVAPTTAAPELVVTPYPNPYQENFSLKVNSPVSGQATIGFYTIDGVKIGELKRDVVSFRDVWVPFNVPAVYRTRIVYTVAVGTHHAKGIVLSPNEP